MAGDTHSQTGVTLLGRLRLDPTNQASWQEFVEKYGRKIYRWCRHWGLQEADAEDVTQMVLLKLARTMQTFDYDPSRSFRAWLKTLTLHAWSDFVQHRQRPGAGSGDSRVLEQLETVEARDDLHQVLLLLHDLFDVLVDAWNFVRAGRQDGNSFLEQVLADGVPAVDLLRLRPRHPTAGAMRSGVEALGVPLAANDERRIGHRSWNHTQDAEARGAAALQRMADRLTRLVEDIDRRD